MILYRWPPPFGDIKEWVTIPGGQDPSKGIFQNWPENTSFQRFIARVYIVRAYDLHPRDPSGKSDPYIEIYTPSTQISDQENFLERQVDPIFGK